MSDLPRPAPAFTLPDDRLGDVTLSDLGPVVLFFYPRDNTSGCTKEAVGFTEALPALEALGVKVFGLSKDTLASHGRFRAKQGLEVGLLSDAEQQVCEAFGVWKEKKMYGKTFMGIERSTFLIDAGGQIVAEWRKVRIAGHVEEVVDTARRLIGGAA
ncbi:MAG: peroxiredoxin [Rhodobacterales bacterium]|nr:MAG: peroxiredoxin [Rhodobacterales bacterium]